MSLQPKPQFSFDDWLAIERDAIDSKSEYVDGEMIELRGAMTGASLAHNLIVASTIGELTIQMKGRPCRVFASDLKLRVEHTNEGFYPDLMALCGEADIYDDRRDVILNPALIVEVLSPSTEAYNRGRKSQIYRTIPSLRDLLLLSQSEVRAELYTRTDDGRWLLTDFRDPQERIPLDSVGCSLSLAEVYDKVELETT